MLLMERLWVGLLWPLLLGTVYCISGRHVEHHFLYPHVCTVTGHLTREARGCCLVIITL